MDWTDRVVAAAAVIVALGVIIGAVWKIYKMVHRVDQALGVDKQGRTVAERLSRVEHQLWPNGGTSLADKVDRRKPQGLPVIAYVAVALAVAVLLWGAWVTKHLLAPPATVPMVVRSPMPSVPVK